MKRPYLKHADRRDKMLAAAMFLAASDGYQNVTRQALARRCSCAAGLVSHYFGSMPSMRRLIMEEAVGREDLIVLAQGLVARDRIALAAPLALRQRAASVLVGGA